MTGTGSIPSAARPDRILSARFASPASAASASLKTSKRLLFATAPLTSAAVTSPAPSNNRSFSISCPAASRLPSTRSAISATASRSGLSPAWRMRAAIQPGNSRNATGQTGTLTPLASSVFAHLDDCALRSSLGPLTTSIKSGPVLSTRSTIACPPARPGLPVGNRSSMIRFSANRDRLAPELVSCPQSNPAAAICRSLAVNPWARAASRIASSASATSKCSSPVTR